MSRFRANLDRGRLGLNEGLPNGLASLNRYIYGIQKKRYYLIGGESGTGKTTLADFMFVFSPYRFMQLNPTIKIHWKYYSFEQGTEAKENSWASKILFDQTKLRLPVAYIMGKGKNRISDEHYKLFLGVDKYLGELFSHIDMVDVPLSPVQFKEDLIRYGRKHGKWIITPILDTSGVQKKSKSGSPLSELSGWTPNDPNASHIIMMDHIAYAQLASPTLKINIDTISRIIVRFREMTNWTFCVIQQFNTELASIERQKFKKNAIAPQRTDFGDSKYTFQDADVVLGMLNPYSYDIPDFGGYNVNKLKGYAIWAFLMKNRHDGPPNRSVPLFMDPVTGMFDELPEPMSETLLAMSDGVDENMEEFYERAISFNEQIKLYE